MRGVGRVVRREVSVGTLLGSIIKSSLPTKAPAVTGVFYCFNHPKIPEISLQYLAP
ncbi:Hypothetical protein P9303_11991 [Prochlorococcus marinus str. MIT 9303]|uniref:Uncharacterized protein n=1 Tax=Prochlorococcus marinus (strain MIT 9303) TaxID=59922 RepID=A2C8Y8_PROM3|nr:Hypothetical protein P9303_11991 [Prochlorococcus marinus str. MIT 9303]